ncbi:MAG: LabA-like NYN domain-containing protein [Candidatus Hermodarchaeia archaeon]|jgi:uncharacterized LabA/DUF88 family protein
MAENRERVMVFIDGSNLLWTAKEWKGHPGFQVDVLKLINTLAKNRRLIRPYFYCGQKTPPEEAQLKFFHKLRYSGVTVVTRPLKQTGSRWMEKGIDVALVTDLLRLAFRNAFDVAIIVSGDRDFAKAFEEVKHLGLKVEVAAFDYAIGDELKRIADRFISLDTIANDIELRAR